jgi:RNA polymerase sigma factor (sigma-70 family)
MDMRTETVPSLGARGTCRAEMDSVFTLESRIARQLHQTVHRLATRAARRYHWVGYPELLQFGSEHALKLCHRFDPSRASFGTFIHRSVATAMRRRAQQLQHDAARLVPDVVSCDDLPDDYISPSAEHRALEFERNVELSRQVSDALRDLAPKDVELLRRVLIEDQSLAEAARELELDYNAAHYRLKMSREKLKRRLARAGVGG